MNNRGTPGYAWQALLNSRKPSSIVRSIDNISQQLPVIFRSNDANELKEFMQAMFKFFEEAESSIGVYERTPQYAEHKDAKPALRRLFQFRLKFFREIPMEPLKKIEPYLDRLLRDFFEKKAPYEPELTACILNRGFRVKDKDTFHLILNNMYHDSTINDFVNKVLCQQTNDALLNEFIETRNNKGKTAWESMFESYNPEPKINTFVTALGTHINSHPAAQVLINKIIGLQNSRQQEELMAKGREDERKAQERKDREEVRRESDHKQPQVQRNQITISEDLARFINDRGRSKNNKDLSTKYLLDADTNGVMCNISMDFPEIPVLLDGRLFDYKNLLPYIKNGFVTDQFSHKEFPVSEIQPGRDAQGKMDRIYEQQEALAKSRAAMQDAGTPAITGQQVFELWTEFTRQRSFIEAPSAAATQIFTNCLAAPTDQLKYGVLRDFINDPKGDTAFQQFLLSRFGRDFFVAASDNSAPKPSNMI